MHEGQRLDLQNRQVVADKSVTDFQTVECPPQPDIFRRTDMKARSTYRQHAIAPETLNITPVGIQFLQGISCQFGREPSVWRIPDQSAKLRGF